MIGGDLGLSPGTAVTGFPPGTVLGTQHVTDAVALQAKNDLTTAYNDAAGRGPAVDQSNKNLGGQTLVGGVYRASAAMALTGTLTLDAQGDPSTVFVFQAGSTLITSSSSTVQLIGAAQACNVFWQVGSSATLGTSTSFVGTIMALTSATLQTNARLEGRVLARNGAVVLDSNVISSPSCATAPPPPPSTSTPPTTTPPTSTPPTSMPPTTTPTAMPTTSSGTPTASPTAPSPTTPSPTTPSSTATPGTGGNGNGNNGNGSGSGSDGGGSGSSGGSDTSGGIIPAGRPDTGLVPVSSSSESRSPLGWLWTAAGLLSMALIALGATQLRTNSSSRHLRQR